MNWIKMEKLDLGRHNLRKFGLTMGTVLCLIAVFVLLSRKHSVYPLILLSAFFFLSVFINPAILRPIYIFWMRLAFILGWFNTRLILIVIFYLIFAPIGLIIRLFGRDLLERKIDKDKSSYWISKQKAVFGKLNYERQF